MASRDEHGLTPKQRAFADLYRTAENPKVRGNAAACYRETYGRGGQTAEVNGSKLLRNAKVKAYLARQTTQTAAEVEITAERVLKEIAHIAFLDPRRIYAEDGSLLPPHDWPDEIAAAVSGIDVVEMKMGEDVQAYTKKVRFWSKDKHLELLTKVLQLVKDNGPTQNIDLNLIYQKIVKAAAQEGRIPGAPPS